MNNVLTIELLSVGDGEAMINFSNAEGSYKVRMRTPDSPLTFLPTKVTVEHNAVKPVSKEIKWKTQGGDKGTLTQPIKPATMTEWEGIDLKDINLKGGPMVFPLYTQMSPSEGNPFNNFRDRRPHPMDYDGPAGKGIFQKKARNWYIWEIMNNPLYTRLRPQLMEMEANGTLYKHPILYVENPGV